MVLLGLKWNRELNGGKESREKKSTVLILGFVWVGFSLFPLFVCR